MKKIESDSRSASGAGGKARRRLGGQRFQAVRGILSLMVSLLLGLALTAAAVAEEPEIKILPSPVDRGTAARIVVEGLEKSGLQGNFDGRPIFFFPSGSGRFIGLFGVDVLLSPGRYPLELSWAGGHKTVEVTVRDRSYGIRSITVPDRQVNLSKADQDRAARERKEVVAALATKSPKRLWSGPWTDPAGGAVSSSFGRQTRINGVLNPRPHLGTDFDVPAGTAVRAPADGLVVLTGDHFFAGQSVYVDHGLGLISMYFHLSRIDVRAGDKVAKGKVLGLSGASGRVSGAHLHYGIYLCQARVDPVAFHRLTALLPRNNP